MLRVACHAVVLLWLGGYLAWSARQTPLEAVLAEATFRVEPRPEEPSPPAEPPEAAPEPAVDPPAPEPAPTRVGRAELARGGELLDGGGDFPALSCSYEDFRSFREYARAMKDLGARFVVVRQRSIVGGVDVENGVVAEADLDAEFSPRARDYTGEPGLANLARAARARFGGDAVVMMLVPRDLDAGLFGGLARAFHERGESHDDYREIRGRYERAASGGVRLRVDSAIRLDGTSTPVDLVFDLTEIARLGGARA